MVNTTFRVRLYLHFEGEIYFTRFLPVKPEAGIEVLIDEETSGRLFMDHRSQFGGLRDPYATAEEYRNFINPGCRGLTAELEIQNVSPGAIAAIGAIEDDHTIGTVRQWPPEAVSVAERIFQLGTFLQDRIADYVRNRHKQYWVRPPILYEREEEQTEIALRRWKTLWWDWQAQSWREFFPGGYATLAAGESLPVSEPITKEDWLALKNFIERGRSSSIIDVLLANSLEWLSERNVRLAMIDSVAALEASYRQVLARAATRLIAIPELEEGKVNRLIEQAGLRSVTAVILPMLQTRADIASDDIDSVIAAVDVRNAFMHSGRHNLQLAKAFEYVAAIHRVISRFRQLAGDAGPSDSNSSVV